MTRAIKDPANLELDIIYGDARMRPFLEVARGDMRIAHRLYMWNTALSARILCRASFVEIGLRNYLDGSLVELTDSDTWWETHYQRFSDYTRSAIDSTRRKIKYAGVQRDEFIAASEFNLWTSLLHKDNAANFNQLANHAFGAKRGAVERPMNDVRRLRNRAAHHKPLISESIDRHIDTINTALEYIDPDLRNYISACDDLDLLAGQYEDFAAGRCHL